MRSSTISDRADACQEPPTIALTNVVYELAGRPMVAERFLTAPNPGGR
jgi:hypothetical protein